MLRCQKVSDLQQLYRKLQWYRTSHGPNTGFAYLAILILVLLKIKEYTILLIFMVIPQCKVQFQRKDIVFDTISHETLVLDFNSFVFKPLKWATPIKTT